MSKKTLLNEATVRRFMKLADMGTLSDNFINEAGLYQADEDEQMEEGGMIGGAAYQDDEPEDEMADEPMADEAPEMPGDEGPEDEPMPEPEMDDMDADEVEISEEDRDVLAQAADILQKIAGGAGGADMDMGMDEPMADEEEPMMEEEVEEGVPMDEVAHEDDEKRMEEGAHEDDEKRMEEGADEGNLDEVELVDENELVQEVTRRVAARLRAAMKSRK